MGNQLTGIVASQIQPVEYYFSDLHSKQIDFVKSLGSTRFFKVARAHGKEGALVVKVFIIHDPSLPLKEYSTQITQIQTQLSQTTNCLPFHIAMVTDKASYLERQYVKDSLYDRISTRPFLCNTEKLWLAFQLLCAVNQCHMKDVCHGDIKSENVMVTGWNWLLLTDFASFKPTYLPEDNPSDFSYFFDTSRRRTCSIAPERFTSQPGRLVTQDGEMPGLESTAKIRHEDLTQQMDMFSVGCVITELFTEGQRPFELSQLLAYKKTEYSPWKVLEKIEDEHIRELCRSMLQKDPRQRQSADEYLKQERGRAFPTYFYTFLKVYMQKFSHGRIMAPDERISRLDSELESVLQHCEVDVTAPEKNSVLVIVLAVITSALRSLKLSESKLMALGLMLKLSKLMTADLVLDRVLPFMLCLVEDDLARVRAEAVRVVAECLASVTRVPSGESNVFQEYIFPILTPLTQDSAATVRVSLAAHVVSLSKSAIRFLEMSQVSLTPDTHSIMADVTGAQIEASYDAELSGLQESILTLVKQLFSDSSNAVRRTLMESGIPQLCSCLGRQKANDVILSHMITFLNDKSDWQIRAAFYETITGVALYVGSHASPILKPLLQQGLTDQEEFVVRAALRSLHKLVRYGVLPRQVVREMLKDMAPLLFFPSAWVRTSAAGVMCGAAERMNIADVHCHLLPLLKPYLQQELVQVNSQFALLSALSPPLPYPIYDQLLRSPLYDKFILLLQNKAQLRQMYRQADKADSLAGKEVGNLFRKLASMGLNSDEETKVLLMKDITAKIKRGTFNNLMDSSVFDETMTITRGGVDIGPNLSRHAYLDKRASPQPQLKKSKKKASVDPAAVAAMNPEWQHMFGTVEGDKPASSTSPQASGGSGAAPGLRPPTSPRRPSSAASRDTQDSRSRSGTPQAASSTGDQGQGVTPEVKGQEKVKGQQPPESREHAAKPEKTVYTAVFPKCKKELHATIMAKREECAGRNWRSEAIQEAIEETRGPPAGWSPRGLLLAHMHEHRAAVNRLAVSPDHSYFASASNDGTVKIWDCRKLSEGTGAANKARQTYQKMGGPVKALTWLPDSKSVAACADNGVIQIFRIDGENSRVLKTEEERKLNTAEDGVPTDIATCEAGHESVIVYGTSYNKLCGWDPRAPRLAWDVLCDRRRGFITTLAVHNSHSWLVCGTSNGALIAWDVRFLLPVATLQHPAGARIRRVKTHPVEVSKVVASVQGNSEVSIWDVETQARTLTLWPSHKPLLSTSEPNKHATCGVQTVGDGILTGGSDMRLRYWDLVNPLRSRILAFGAMDNEKRVNVSYRSQLVDGTEVLHESYTEVPHSRGRPGAGPHPAAAAAATPEEPHAPDTPSPGHCDVISDVTCATPGHSQSIIVTASRDGVVKVWR